jgi:hypothetical protein
MKNKQVETLSFVASMGKTASFYVPADKLHDSKYGRDGHKPSQMFEKFFVTHFGGFTHEQSQIKGRWMGEGGTKMFTDEHQRYEVAFSGKHNATLFLNFLSEMCGLMEEGSIYLNYGGRSWLISPPSVHPDAAEQSDGNE